MARAWRADLKPGAPAAVRRSYERLLLGFERSLSAGAADRPIQGAHGAKSGNKKVRLHLPALTRKSSCRRAGAAERPLQGARGPKSGNKKAGALTCPRSFLTARREGGPGEVPALHAAHWGAHQQLALAAGEAFPPSRERCNVRHPLGG